MPPAVSNLVGFSERLIAFDLLHIVHLGTMRDLVGSCLKLMCRNKSFYTGRNIQKRLAQFTSELKAWAGANGVALSLNKIQKATLGWAGNTCPVFKAKAADALAVLRFVSSKFQRQAPSAYGGVVASVWALENFVGCLASASIFLEDDERNSAYELGMLYLRSYVSLAAQSVLNGDYFFKIRPKFHYLLHVVEDLGAGQIRNIYFDTTFVDEDFIKVAMTLKKKMHSRTASLNILKRFCVMNRSALDKVRLRGHKCKRVSQAQGCSTDANAEACCRCGAWRSGVIITQLSI